MFSMNNESLKKYFLIKGLCMNYTQKVLSCILLLSMGTMLITASSQKQAAQQKLADRKQAAQQKASQLQQDAQQKKQAAQQKALQLQQEAQQKLAEQKQAAAQKTSAAKEKIESKKSESDKSIGKQCRILFYHEKTKELVGVMKDLKEVANDPSEKNPKNKNGFLVKHEGKEKHLSGVCKHPKGDKDTSGKSLKGKCDSESRWYFLHCPDEKSEKIHQNLQKN